MSDKPVTPTGLNLRHVYADDLTKTLLPHTTLTAESLDLINQAFNLPHGRNLSVRVGRGIIYRSALETSHGDKIEAIITCRDDAFIFPMEVAVNVAVELQQAHHEQACKFRRVAWTFGDVTCNCPYLDYVNHVIMVNTEADFKALCELIQTATGHARGDPLLQRP